MIKQTKVTWRLTEAEFYRKVDEWILVEFEKLKCNADSGAYIGECEKQINTSISKIKAAENDNQPLSEIRKLKVIALCHDITFWSNFSRSYNDPDEVIFRILINRIFDVQHVCLSYICGVKNQLNEQMIKDIIFINSDLFDFTYWDDYHVDLINSIIVKGGKYNCINDLENLVSTSKRISPVLRKNIQKWLNNTDNDKEVARKIASAKRRIGSTEEKIETVKKELSLFKSFSIENNKDKSYYVEKIKEFVNLLEKEVPEFNDKFWNTINRKIYLFNRSRKKESEEDLRKFVLYDIEDLLRDKIDKLNEQIEKSNILIDKLSGNKNDLRKFILTERLDWKNIHFYQSLSLSFKKQYEILFKQSFETDQNQE